MKEAHKKNDQDAGPGIRFLLCDLTGNIANRALPDEEWVSSPIQCLDRAVDLRPGIIVIYFGRTPIQTRETLVELCRVLKRNRVTQPYPVLALLHAKHRRLLEDLGRAHVEYLRYLGEAKLNSTMVRELLESLGPEDRLERHLDTVCPFLHYSLIDMESELTVCGAYRDRLVLGGRRLHGLCESPEHLQCEYYINPRSSPCSEPIFCFRQEAEIPGAG